MKIIRSYFSIYLPKIHIIHILCVHMYINKLNEIIPSFITVISRVAKDYLTRPKTKHEKFSLTVLFRLNNKYTRTHTHIHKNYGIVVLSCGKRYKASLYCQKHHKLYKLFAILFVLFSFLSNLSSHIKFYLCLYLKMFPCSHL